MGRLYILMGKSASGKDSLYEALLHCEELHIKPVVGYTTRPIRSGEENGREYFFTDETEFQRLSAAGKIVEQRVYQTVHGPWRYFTVDDGRIVLEKDSYLYIGTLESYVKIRDYYGAEHVVPLYIEVEDGLRLSRALSRERQQTNPRYAELCRRFLADTEDFSEEKLKQAEIRTRYENVEFAACLEQLKATIKQQQ